jgi:hypothetical protein
MKRTLGILMVALVAVWVYVGNVQSQPAGTFNLIANDSVAPIFFRMLGTYGQPATIGSGSAVPTAANSGAPPVDGEMFVVTAAATEPDLQFWSANSGAWHSVAQIDIAETFGAAVTINGTLDTNGAITSTVYRDEFSRPCFVREEDYTAEAVSDAAMNIVQCLDGIAPQYHFRIDGAQASPFIQEATAGAATTGPYMIDMDSDAANTEGVEIVFADDPQAVQAGAFVFGQTVRFRWGLHVVDISDTGIIHGGFRLNEDYIDNQVLATIDSYVSWSSPAGVTSATSGLNGADDTELEAGCDMADNTDMIFEIQLSATGIGTFLCGATEATLAAVATPTVLAGFEAGDIFVPYVSMQNGAAAGGEYHLLFVEIEYTDE